MTKLTENFISTYSPLLSQFKDEISSPHHKINTWEWYINFENLIVPDEMLADISYQIAAHIEPSEPLWEVGKGIIGNIKAILNNIKNTSCKKLLIVRVCFFN